MTMNNRFSGSFGHAADQEKSIPKAGVIENVNLMGKNLAAATALTLLAAIGHGVDTGRFDGSKAALDTHAAALTVGGAGGGITTDASRVASADKFESYKPAADNELLFTRNNDSPTIKTPGMG